MPNNILSRVHVISQHQLFSPCHFQNATSENKQKFRRKRGKKRGAWGGQTTTITKGVVKPTLTKPFFSQT
jgi:hypothetical protein